MARVPIIKVGNVLIVTFQEELLDRDALVLQEELCVALERTGATGVLLDVSAIDTLDSFLGRLLNEIAVGSKLLGAMTVVSGIQPAVAVTLVELGLELSGIKTALNSEKGLALLHGMTAVESWQRRHGRV